jgi:hypothetical protein
VEVTPISSEARNLVFLFLPLTGTVIPNEVRKLLPGILSFTQIQDSSFVGIYMLFYEDFSPLASLRGDKVS